MQPKAMPIVDLQRVGENQIDTSIQLMTRWARGWQAIAMELSDFGKRALQHQIGHTEQLLRARSLEQAYELNAAFAKRSFDDYVAQTARLNGLCVELANEAIKPVGASARPTQR